MTAPPIRYLVIQKGYPASSQVIQAGHSPETNLSLLFPNVVPKAPNHYSCRFIEQKEKFNLEERLK